MGKYNFSAMKFDELEKRLAALEKRNEELAKENARLKLNKTHRRRGLARDLANIDKAKKLLSIEAKGGVVKTTPGAFDKRFLTFYQNIFLVLSPMNYTDPKTGSERIRYSNLDGMTDEEYKVHVETIEAVIDLIYYAKEKLEGLKNGNKNDT